MKKKKLFRRIIIGFVLLTLILGIAYFIYYKITEKEIKEISKEFINVYNSSELIPEEFRNESAESENIKSLKEKISDEILTYFVDNNDSYRETIDTILDYIDLQLEDSEEMNESISGEVLSYQGMWINLSSTHMTMIIKEKYVQGYGTIDVDSKYSVTLVKEAGEWKISSFLYEGPAMVE